MDELQMFRVVVRGHFGELDDETRRRLLDEADEHDIFQARFTREGWWVYDRQLVAFNVRFEVRGRGPDAADDARRHAEAATTAMLGARGVPFKRLRTSVTDMREMWR